MRGVGSLTIRLEIGTTRVQSVRLCIPALAVDQHLIKFTRIENLPAGAYDGTLTTYLTTGQESKQRIRVNVAAGQENPHIFNLSEITQDVTIRPIDGQGRTLVGTEIKIENVSPNFRPIRDWKGLSFKLAPGEYKVKLLLPGMRVNEATLRVTGGVYNYTIPVEDKKNDTPRKERRLPVTIPADYRTAEGYWISTQTINVSSTGICLVKRPWKFEDSNITVRLFVPVLNLPIECPARVRWSKDEGISQSQMGVELFLTATMRSSLANWLAQKEKGA
jgi:hypothetical protein